GGVERELDVLRRRPRHLRERLPGRRGHVLRVLTLHRRNPASADEVVVPLLQLDRTTGLTRRGIRRLLLDRRHLVSLPVRVRPRLPRSSRLSPGAYSVASAAPRINHPQARVPRWRSSRTGTPEVR